MSALDYAIIAIIAVWFILAIVYIIKHGSCGCGGKRGGKCSRCKGCNVRTDNRGSCECCKKTSKDLKGNKKLVQKNTDNRGEIEPNGGN